MSIDGHETPFPSSVASTERSSVGAQGAAVIETEARYAGYLDRQAADIRAFRRDEDLALPSDLDYGEITALSNEVRARLQAVRPATIGQAARIPGVTPAAVLTLLRYVKRRGGDPRSRQVA